jgi:hypothetical protein
LDIRSKIPGTFCNVILEKDGDVRSEEVLQRIKKEKIFLQTIKIKRSNCIGHTWRKNSLLKCVIEGNIEGWIEVTGKQRKQLLDNNKEARGYWKLKQEELDHTPWRTRAGRGYGPVLR